MSDEVPENSYTIDIQLRFNDTDQAGHVNHATFVTYLETARIEWIADEGKKSGFEGIPLIIARVEIDYLQPIHLYHSPKVSMWVSRIGTKSFDFDYIIHDKVNGEDIVFAKATSVQVYFDYEKQKSREIPSGAREVLKKYLVTAEKTT